MSARRRLVRALRAARQRVGAPPPGYWADYLALDGLPPDLPVEEIPFAVIDTETTGLDYRADRVVSFGGVRLRGGRIAVAEAVHFYVRGDLPSDPDSIEVHGVLNRELEHGVPQSQLVERVVRFVRGDVIVGYRPGFDLALLNRLVREQTGGRLDNPTLDVFELGMRLDYPLKPAFVNPEGYRFDTLCQRYDIEQSHRHTALGDAYATALLLAKLLARLRAQGVTTLRELTRRYL